LSKRIVIRSAILALAAAVVGLLVNLVSYRSSNRLLFAVRRLGGDCFEYQGLGWRVLEIYPETESGAVRVVRYLSFDPVSFVVTFALAFVVVLVVSVVVAR
jgi:ABC-type antimicrobial peptide transport system permease subunit